MNRMANLDLDHLWSITLGDPRIVIAILDGPVDTEHDCQP